MSDATVSFEVRSQAANLAAEVCRGSLPTGTTLLSYVILFQTYLLEGSTSTAAALGWDVVDRPPVSLAEIRASLSVTSGDEE